MSFAFGTLDGLRETTGVNFTGEGVRITFQHTVEAWGQDRTELRRKLNHGEAPKAVMGSAVCVSWSETSFKWSPDDCRRISSHPDRTVCECRRLGAFAVLMDLHGYVGRSAVLEIMTWALCTLSIVCLLLTITVLLYSRFGKQLLSKHRRNDLTLNLSISLLVAKLLILFTMDKHVLHLRDEVCCSAAIVLHYVLLVAFAWMALEGILLARLVFFDVFASGREYAGLEWIGALGVPAIIVGVTYGVSFGRGDSAYRNDGL